MLDLQRGLYVPSVGFLNCNLLRTLLTKSHDPPRRVWVISGLGLFRAFFRLRMLRAQFAGFRAGRSIAEFEAEGLA